VDLRPEPRLRDQALLRYLKVEYDCCEVTGSTRDLHLHHVVLRSQGGDDLRANIVCVSKDIHDRYHTADPVVRLMLAEYVRDNRPDTVAYLQKKLGEDGYTTWLERHGTECQQNHGLARMS